MTSQEFKISARVKRKTVAGSDVWNVRLACGTEFVANSENDVREAVRLHILDRAAKEMGVDKNTLTTKLTRTWEIRVIPSTSDDDEDNDGGYVMNLFD